MTRPSTQLVLAALLIAMASPRMVLAQPSLSHALPGAAAPGKTTEVVLHGTKLDGALKVWTSFPAQIEVVAGDAKAKDRSQITCKLTLAAGVPVGIGGIVVANATGVSDVAYLMVDDLPSAADSGKNHEASQPQEISLPVAIDGQCDGTFADYYRFEAKAGERISCDVVATRLGWDFDPLVRVLDAKGHELLIADDDPATGSDPRFVFTAPSDGQYLLELRDNRYKPGGRYRLRLGDFPLVSTTMPLVVQRGVPTEVGFCGPLVDTSGPATILATGSREVGLSAPQLGNASGWATLGVSDLPVFSEGNTLKLPCVATGTLDVPRQRDVFAFQGAKGTPLRFRAITRSSGSPAILSLRVWNSDGKQLAESPVTESDEPVLAFAPPADGSYQLAVDELAGRGGNDFTYAIECQSGPQFSLLLKVVPNDKVNRLRYSLPTGGAFYLDVQCQRAAYDGPIALAIDSPRAGWQIFNNVIAAKTNEVRVYVVPPLDWSASDLAELRVIGRAESGGKEVSASMTTTTHLRLARPSLPYPPKWHDGAIFVSGQNAKPAFFFVAASSSVDLPRQAGQAQLTLDFERTDPKFKDTPLTVVPLGLPAGVTAEIKRNGNGPKETYDIVLKGEKELAAGDHTFRYFTYAELAGQGRGTLSGDIRLKITGGEK